MEENDLRAFVNNADWNLGASSLPAEIVLRLTRTTIAATGDTLDPVIHLMLYVPSAENRPMRIRAGGAQTCLPSTAEARTDWSCLCGSDEIKPTSAFIMPQRGGVVILNPLSSSPESPPSVPLDVPSSAFAAPFRLFEQQLRVLLGLETSRSGGGGQAQVDRLIHRRTREAVEDCVETLQATVKMARDIPNMRISKEVQERIKRALDELDKVSWPV